jgi:hypothetical protein
VRRKCKQLQLQACIGRHQARIATFANLHAARASSTDRAFTRAAAALVGLTGYGAFSMGASQIDDVRTYIADQEEHHRRMSFQDELRKLLGRYGIDFDERYVWN